MTPAWRKSSHSTFNGSCLEWAFRKSSHSNGGNCAEAAARDGVVLVRDSKMAPGRGCEGPEGPHLSLTLAAWREFIAGVKAA